MNKEGAVSLFEDLKSLETPEERAQRFYDQQILLLSDDVTKAETARQWGDYPAVDEIDDKWRGEDNRRAKLILKKLERRTLLIKPQTGQTVKAGLAGVGRITHVNHHSRFKTGSIDTETLTAKVQEINRLYHDFIGLENLPNLTIHGGSIFWPGEIAQDNIRTAELSGNSQVVNLVFRALSELENIRNQLEQEVNLRKKTGSEEKRRLLIAILYASAVIKVRESKMSHNLPGIQVGLSEAGRAFKYEKNAHRLATLAFWALQESTTTIQSGNLMERDSGLRLQKEAWRYLLIAFISNPKESFSVLKPELEKRGLTLTQLTGRARIFLERIVPKLQRNKNRSSSHNQGKQNYRQGKYS